MKTTDVLGQKIREIRQNKLKVSQKELAEKLKVTPVYLSYLEQGKKVPSREFLEALYNVSGESSVPEDIFDILRDSKVKLKEKKQHVQHSQNVIYLMEEQGIYNERSLKQLLDKEPDNIYYIYGMLTLLLRDKRFKDAEHHLLNSLLQMENPEEKKWLQAAYHKLEGDFELSIHLMQKAVRGFEKNNPVLSNDRKKKKALLLFQTACMFYEYGQFLYNQGNKSQARENFFNALDYHKRLRSFDCNPFYQMDYAGIFFWLAFLGESPKENYLNYISEARQALQMNYYEGIANFPSRGWKSVYSKPYIYTSLSFIGRCYGELSLLENNRAKRAEYLYEGEKIFIQATPLELNPGFIEYYRFLFNQACFYSSKAELKDQEGEEYEKELDLCYRILLEAARADNDNSFKLMYGELKSPEGLTFFKKERKKDIKEINRGLKKTAD